MDSHGTTGGGKLTLNLRRWLTRNKMKSVAILDAVVGHFLVILEYPAILANTIFDSNYLNKVNPL
jgi:hypothetical protein